MSIGDPSKSHQSVSGGLMKIYVVVLTPSQLPRSNVLFIGLNISTEVVRERGD